MGQARRNKLNGLRNPAAQDTIKQFKQSNTPSLLLINEEEFQTPQYKNIDVDYECFVEYMKMLDMDWEKIKEKGMIAEVMLCLNPDPATYRYQPCFTLPPNSVMENGMQSIEFGIWVGVWKGIKGVIEMISAQTKKPMRVITACGGGNEFRFALMCE